MPFSVSSARVVLLYGLLWLLSGCTDPFTPDVVKTPPSYLVVDGYINVQGVSTFKLTRTLAIASPAAPPVEARATVYIEEEGGPRYQLREAPLGTYATTTALNLNPAKKYRVHLNTVGGKEYASDYVPAKITPPVDNVSWRVNNNELSVYVNAHDATNRTQYYRWETAETWEIFPQIIPKLEYVNRVLRFLTVPYPRVCYGTAPSSTVQLYKTTGLSQDVVSDFRVKRMSPTSERLIGRYSILVQQIAMSKEEYGYWELLKKNTESIGTLYDPQPAQLTGNVHCLSNPDEVALGFVGAHTVTEKRLFITRQELPNPRDVMTGYEKCFPVDSIYVPPRGVDPAPTPDEVLFTTFGKGDYLPIESFSTPAGNGVLGTSRDCIDCRSRGSAVKPSFWP